MFTSKVHGYLDWGLVSYYWEKEPHFSLDDGRNAWRFIVDQMEACLTGTSEPQAPVGVVRRQAVTAKSCAVVRNEPKPFPVQ